MWISARDNWRAYGKAEKPLANLIQDHGTCGTLHRSEEIWSACCGDQTRLLPIRQLSGLYSNHTATFSSGSSSRGSSCIIRPHVPVMWYTHVACAVPQHQACTLGCKSSSPSSNSRRVLCSKSICIENIGNPNFAPGRQFQILPSDFASICWDPACDNKDTLIL